MPSSSPSPIIVRPLATPAEHELYFPLADQAFSPDPSPNSARYWQQFVTSTPEYHPETIRGAFRGDEELGGYILYERTLRMGAAGLTTGCIAAVVTHPAHRHQGVATALMHDAIDYALSHKYALLLLDGIPKFYERFGYSDMFDLSAQDIERNAVLAQPPSTHTVRPATLDDVGYVLALYDYHYGPYTGSFTHTLKQQTHQLQHRQQDNPLLLAIDPGGQPQGYLSVRRSPNHFQAQEFAADNWSAALALLQYHAHVLPLPAPQAGLSALYGPDASVALRYLLPSTAPTVQWMIDHLEVQDTSQWTQPPEEWVVRTQTYHHRNAAWMARPAHLPTLLEALLPEWQARWQRSLSHWSGNLSLAIGKEVSTLHIDGTELQLVDQPGIAADAIQLTPQTFTQILFGYRPVAWALQQSEQTIPDTLLSVLNVLFPSGHTWIPASDWF